MSELRRSLAAVVLLLVCAGCDTPSESARPGAIALLDIVSGDGQEFIVGEELPDPLVVRVLDSNAVPIPGQLVNFRVMSGDGSVFASASITNQQGLARERWTLGTVAGDTQRVEARAVDNNTGQALVFATFKALGRAAAPATVTSIGTPDRTGSAGTPLSDSIAVKVTDRYGNPVPASAVVWRVEAGGGSVSPQTGVTDGYGVARALWTLGPRMDTTQVVTAAAGIGVSTLFKATAALPPIAVLTRVAGDGQRGTVATELSDPLVISVTLPDGRPLPGATVTWSLESNAGDLSFAVATADHAGLTSTRWTLGTVAGVFSATATVAGASPVSFQATTMADTPIAITPIGPSDKSGPAGTALADSIAVQLTDRYGNVVPGSPVVWEIQAGGGAVSPANGLTDDQGVARAQWMLGPRMDIVQVLHAAAGAGLSAEWRAAATSPSHVVISRVAGDGQRGIVATELPDALVVLLSLPDGRPLTGATVNWAIDSVAGSLSPAAATTDSAGHVSARWTFGTSAGEFTANATVAGASPVAFNAAAEADAPATLTKSEGDGQIADVGTMLPEMLSARVTDQFGNPVSDALVRWAVTSQGGSVQPDSSRTDDNGIAQTSWTVGPGQGPGTATGTVGALPPVVFSATARTWISMQLKAPLANAFVGDTLTVVVSTNSQREVRTLTATVDGQTTDLALVSGDWRGQMLLDGRLRGLKELLVIATDLTGDTAAIVSPFIHDRAPRLLVTSPEWNIVSRGGVHIVANCEDDDPTGCEITVSLAGTAAGELRQIAHGTHQIDATISLATEEGKTAILVFDARDSSGQTERVIRTVFVESSTHWTEILSAGTYLRDINSERVLYEDSSTAGISLRIRDRVTGVVSTVFDNRPDAAYLTPRGAMFTAGTTVYEWRDGSLLDLGHANPTGSLRVAGPWAIWNTGTAIVHRDLNASTNLDVWSERQGCYFFVNSANDVAANGDAVFVGGCQQENGHFYGNHVLYRVGVGLRELDAITDYQSCSSGGPPLTDGVNVISLQQCWLGGRYFPVTLWNVSATGQRQRLLDFERYLKPLPHQDYEVNNGWFAYTKPGSGTVLQVWTRAPDAVQRQVSPSGMSGRIAALGPNGEVAFISGNRVFLRAFPYTEAAVDIGSAWSSSRFLWVNGELIVMLGSSAFRVDW